MSKGLKLSIGIVLILLLIAALYLFYSFDPEINQFFPGCPFLLTTGYECPGCGSQRAIHHLLHFNIREAANYNILMVLFLPYILLGIYFEYFRGKKRHPKLMKIFFGRWSALIVLIIIVFFWILRNIKL